MYAVVAEWLRRLTRNQLRSPCTGLNPVNCATFFLPFLGSGPEGANDLCFHTYSPVPCGRNQKHIGVFGGSYQNLHTGTVFDAEQGGKSHLAKKWHGPLKKRVFRKKIWEKLR